MPEQKNLLPPGDIEAMESNPDAAPTEVDRYRRSWRNDKTPLWERQISGAFQTARLPAPDVCSKKSPTRDARVAEFFNTHLGKWCLGGDALANIKDSHEE